MKSLPLSVITAMSGGALIQGCPAEAVSGVGKDSRAVESGSLYVALSGENFNGHQFIKQAEEQGAVAVLVSELTASSEQLSGGVIHVKDTLSAMQELARNYRKSLSDFQVVAVTGSNGKTSTKDFITSILKLTGGVSATLGNLNNHIGLPLTILSTDEDDRVGVWEMGMSHPGEIEVLAEIAGPDIGVITNIGVAHLEHMGSREAIALEKGMLAESLPQDGWLIMPEQDEFTSGIAARTRAKLLTVGIDCGDLQAQDLIESAAGTQFKIVDNVGAVIEVEISVPGRHMVVNALLAAAVAKVMQVDESLVAKGLSSTQLTSGRLQQRQINGLDILDDSYNANPDSMAAALQTLATLPCEGRRCAALGVMAELGDQAATEHSALATEVAEAGVELLVTVGELPGLIGEGLQGKIEVRNFADCDQAGQFLKETLEQGDLLLVKGSRSAGMEKVIERLKD
ncbi:MAG: UDP-N-acetylmuramoyl-tripeptide--D-alanyl-D-alanine ligase [Verrucomicrobiales bacterium]|nr:UDP-N-acetylmuramoyl-tripeptide--D-alanyl-D-alanine ligase [Verrucomicrobiales bacterium]